MRQKKRSDISGEGEVQPAGQDAVVAVVRCDDYTPDRVDAAVRRAIDTIGGIWSFVILG